MCSELTPEDVKRRFEQAGETICGWAEKHGFPKDAVYAILNPNFPLLMISNDRH